MPAKRTSKILARLDPTTIQKFKELCRRHGISQNEGLRREMIGAIMRGTITGVDPLDHMVEREQEKYGKEAVPSEHEATVVEST